MKQLFWRTFGAAAQDARSRRALLILSGAALLSAALYQFAFVNPKFFGFAMELRAPRLLAMAAAGAAISAAAIVFQTIIRNRIVTPCLLGMNSLYVLVHTAVAFVWGATSAFAVDPVLSFALDIVVMGTAATFIYNTIFARTGGNVLYVLLIGTVLSTFFSSVQSSLTRLMDPNEYDALINSLVASFTNVNVAVLLPAMAILAAIGWALRREIALLDVVALGRDAAIGLGVDYERVVRRLMVGVALSIAAATALVGPLSFLGLITANLAREMLGSHRHKPLLLASALIGVVIVVAGQFIVEHFAAYSVPVSVFVTIGGGIYFLALLLREMRGR